MKVVILAGGLGTRISEESHLRPKPMIEVGNQPILWHIMKIYSQQGYRDFIICAGYKQSMIKEYFADYFLHASDITFDLQTNSMQVHENYAEPWRVTVVDTGLNTMTGGRVKRIQKYVNGERFMLTYGDGVGDIDLAAEMKEHERNKAVVTIAAINVGQRFGVMSLDEGGRVGSFREKRDGDGGVINGGFMILESDVFDYLKDDQTVFEREPLEALAREGKLFAYRHKGFWQCMDTQRDKEKLEKLWAEGDAPWKIWDR